MLSISSLMKTSATSTTGTTVGCQKILATERLGSHCAAGVEWALESTDWVFLPCLSNVWVMARIWSLTSASSSILVWRCSKIRGSTIPEAMFGGVLRRARQAGFSRNGASISPFIDLQQPVLNCILRLVHQFFSEVCLQQLAGRGHFHCLVVVVRSR